KFSNELWLRFSLTASFLSLVSRFSVERNLPLMLIPKNKEKCGPT
ncbi:5375_t:CDS:1, partial [Funneliformis mosseae]